VVTQSTEQKDKVPTKIELKVGYYQMDQKNKKIISSEIVFSGYIDPRLFNSSQFNYTLLVSYEPLSHTNLTISFALPWFVYLSMYLIIGVLCVGMVLILVIYHKVFTYKKNTQLIIWGYLKIYIAPCLWGFWYLLLPLVLHNLLVAVVFTHHLM
jgi:hypothetical protein